ncbi:hypothetical protein L195_g046784, partial [Trifolium pratense]
RYILPENMGLYMWNTMLDQVYIVGTNLEKHLCELKYQKDPFEGRDTDSAGNNVNDGKGMDNDSEDAIAGNGDEERCDTDTAGNNVNDGKGMDND